MKHGNKALTRLGARRESAAKGEGTRTPGSQNPKKSRSIKGIGPSMRKIAKGGTPHRNSVHYRTRV